MAQLPLCGCYIQPEQSGYHTEIHYLPLVASEVHSTIFATTTRTVLKQNFLNPSSKNTIQCSYMFPLYDGVSVVSFTCRIGDKVLKGVIKEKEKARSIFDEAVAGGQIAGLLEQSSEASDVFSTKLGNIPAGATITVEVVYVGELKHDAETNGIRFTIPTNIAPRYGSGPLNHLYTADVPVRDDGGMKITVDTRMTEGMFIQGIQSPSHPIAVSMGVLSTAAGDSLSMSKASATLSHGSTALDKDFVMVVLVKDSATPKAVLETHPTVPSHRALMVTLVPKFSLPATQPEIVFVADRSGSMESNIPMLITAMKVFLKSLPTGVKFNICSFGNCHSFLWDKSKAYTAETLAEATHHVETFNARMGGTETFAAIKATIENRFADLPLEVILLTDGDIWSQQSLFAYVNEEVAKSSGNIRVFPLGIGNGVSHALIEGLARAGNGFAQTVQSGERFDKAVVKMLRGALSPHINDYTLEVNYKAEEDSDEDFELVDKVVDGVSVLLIDDKTENVSGATSQEPASQETTTQETTTQEPTKPTISLFDPNANPEEENIKDVKEDLPDIPHPKLLQAPHQITPLFAFSRTVVYLLMPPSSTQKAPISVTLKATSTHGPLELTIPVEVLETPGETIHQLGARKVLQDYEEGRGWLFDATLANSGTPATLVKDRYPGQFDSLVQREAVRVGEQFQIASKWTSFVAVDTSTNQAEDTPATLAPEKGAMRCSVSRPPRHYHTAYPMSTGNSQFPRAPEPAMRASDDGPYPNSRTAYHMSSDTRSTDSSSYLFDSNSNAAPEPFQVPTEPIERVLALIDRQSFHGSWDMADKEEILAIMAIDQSKQNQVDEPFLLTMLVVVFLETKMKEERGVWKLVVQKARKWLGMRAWPSPFFGHNGRSLEAIADEILE